MKFVIVLLMVTTNTYAAFNVCECTTKKNWLGYVTSTDCKRMQKVELVVTMPCTPGQKTQTVTPELILHTAPATSAPAIPKTPTPPTPPSRVPWWEK